MADNDKRKDRLGADRGRSIIRSSGVPVQQKKDNGIPEVRNSGKNLFQEKRTDIRRQTGNRDITDGMSPAGNRISVERRNDAGNRTVTAGRNLSVSGSITERRNLSANRTAIENRTAAGSRTVETGRNRESLIRKQKADYLRAKLGRSPISERGLPVSTAPQIRTAAFTCRGRQADPSAIRAQIRRDSVKKQMTIKKRRADQKKKLLHISRAPQDGERHSPVESKTAAGYLQGRNPGMSDQASRIKELLHVSSGNDHAETVKAVLPMAAMQKENIVRAELSAGKDPGRLGVRDRTSVIKGNIAGKKHAEIRAGQRYKKLQIKAGKDGQKQASGKNGQKGMSGKKRDFSAIKKQRIKAYAITKMLAKKAAMEEEQSSEKETRQIVRSAADLYYMIRALVYVILHIGTAVIVMVGLLIGMLVMILFSTVFVVSSASGSPQAYFEQAYADEDSLTAHQKYIDSALQKKYNALSNDVADFLGASPYNQVVYSSGVTYNWNSVLAVYFSMLCTSDGYDDCYNKRDSVAKDFPQYFLVDTSKEKDLLKDTFKQMNYTVTEEIQVSVPNADGTGTVQVAAQKMTVFSLSVDQWMAVHGSSLSEEAKELLELLKEYENQYAAGGGGTAGGGEYTPLEGITIPEGANASLIYMAGFLEAEAGGQPEEGQRAVAYVMLNRAGGNVNGVIAALLAPSAFSCYIPYHTVEAKIQKYAAMTEEQRNADPIYSICAAAASGQSANPIGTWRYYCNPNGCAGGAVTQWAKIRAKNSEAEYRQIGDHVFCSNGWW